MLAGHRLAPGDDRFLVELGGVAFKQKRFTVAARRLRSAVAIRPDNAYANDFLGTLYFLQGNTEAALKFWNRVGKPRIADLRMPDGLETDPVLLDSAFTFAGGSTLRLDDFRTTRARIAGLGVFPNGSLGLDAQRDGTFAVNFTARERNGWGGNKWQALLSTFRGLAYQAVHPEYFHIGGGAVNLTSMIRWDPQKRRLIATVSAPLRDARYRYWLGFDGRDEDWELHSGDSSLGRLQLRRTAIGGGISSFRNGHWFWSTGGEFSHRDYDDVLIPEPSTIRAGYQLKHSLLAGRDLWRSPERRFESEVQVSSEAGRIWSQSSSLFERLQLSSNARWLPQMTGDDYAIHARVRAGSIFGQVGFDELFILGLERDNDLWMRAHIGTRDGRKGSAPIGREYVLANWDFDKNVYNDGLFVVRLSPFLDTGRIWNNGSPLAARTWLWDTGVQAKIRVFGVGWTLTYGKDLRSGNNVFYLMAGPVN